MSFLESNLFSASEIRTPTTGNPHPQAFFLSWISRTQPNHWAMRIVRTRLTTYDPRNCPGPGPEAQSLPNLGQTQSNPLLLGKTAHNVGGPRLACILGLTNRGGVFDQTCHVDPPTRRLDFSGIQIRKRGRLPLVPDCLDGSRPQCWKGGTVDQVAELITRWQDLCRALHGPGQV